MNLDDGLEGVDAHAMEDGIAQNAGIVDHTVKFAKAFDGHLDDPAGRNGFRDRFEIRHRRAAALSDFLDHLFGWRGAGTRTVGGDPGIVDDDVGALGGAKQRDLASDAAPRAGDDDGFALE
jgi:hypothetical protein